jgi:hypothetical protein
MLNLLRRIDRDNFSMNRLYQQAARKDLSPSEAIATLRGLLIKYEELDLSMALSVNLLPHVDVLRDYVTMMGPSGLTSDKEKSPMLMFLDEVVVS